ncbi:MAG: hypothetical protein M1828_006339 [Chrysothrix sp. TS-e1954]|nr:MAG: hypothetical protein M1828_006339 [Chrysothrix sp. TS-e1954]
MSSSDHTEPSGRLNNGASKKAKTTVHAHETSVRSTPATSHHIDGQEDDLDNDIVSQDSDSPLRKAEERRLTRHLDLRLCTIAGLLFSLDLLDSGIISSASVTSLFDDISLSPTHYSLSIYIFTIASILFQLPATILVRRLGPRVFFSCTTALFGLVTLCTAFVRNWRELVALRVLLGISMSGIYPGLTYLVSTWYLRREQQKRFALLQTGEVFVLASGGILNYGLQHLDGRAGLEGWRWMFLVQGLIAIFLGVIAYWWLVDFPENSQRSFKFLTPAQTKLAVERVQRDRGDVHAEQFTPRAVLRHWRDPKIYGFACMLFLLNLVSTALSYFLPIILQSGMGFSTGESILLAAPPYYYAIVPVLLSSYVSDRYQLRGPVVVFNSLVLILGFALLGFSGNVAARYAGTFLATGAYVSNWAALSAYWSNNVAGQWKRVFTAAVVTAFNGAGGVAGSYIFRADEAPRYPTAIWTCVASHVGMIAFVAVFTAGFWWANGRQRLGRRVIEGTVGFRHTY